MAVTPTAPKNQRRIMDKIISVLTRISDKDADTPVGAATIGHARRRCWVSAGTPDTDATGILAGDLILDITNDEVYRFISTGVFVNITADS